MTMEIEQFWPSPKSPQPIVIIGCGGIVNDAHLPAYKKVGLPVAGVYDLNKERMQQTAAKWQVPSFDSFEDAIAQTNVVFDIAVPPESTYDILKTLPSQSTVMLQKPMGVDLADAKRILALCKEQKHVASVNFQMRFSPMMLAAKAVIDAGTLGSLVDVTFHFNVHTPWSLFPYLKKLPRCEILMHTIHHLDFCRHILGEPKGVYARTLQHPSDLELSSTKTSIILDYGQQLRCMLSINHNYEFGPEDECADVRIQGTEGALKISLGVLLNYPKGKTDTLSYCGKDKIWRECSIEGSWFPDGFSSIMNNLQRYAAGEDQRLYTNVEDAYRTMALVEACYQSDASGATPIPE